MKRPSYRDQDHAFGQVMRTLRTAIGLTQAGLAELLRVSRHAVGGWEAGQSYPKAEHLKQLIELGIQQQVFAAGREAEDIRALWRASHQKVLVDEAWLEGLLKAQPSASMRVEQTGVARAAAPPLTKSDPQVDWSDAFDVSTFYGRNEERALLSRWLIEERCRVVSVLGMGGLGKSTLAVTAMREVAAEFEVVIWRSLRDTPTCEALLHDCLQVLAPQPRHTVPDSLDGCLNLLIEHMRQRRVLLVLDNLEVLLEEATGTGRMRAGAEGYARLLRRIGETAHGSCLLLTSREKPAELVPLEGSRSLVRALRLAGLDAGAGAQLLAEKNLLGSSHDRARLVEMYDGNPLALKIVAQTIVELFAGEIAPFLKQGEVVLGGVRQLLDEQFARLAAHEQMVLYWLAILREPTTLKELGTLFNTPVASTPLLEALEGLIRRSMVERGQRAGSFTLQSVVLEYATARFVAEVSNEIEQGTLDHLSTYAFCQAQARDYVRRTQEQLLVQPILTRLRTSYQGQAEIEMRLLALLDQVRSHQAQGYGPANLLALMCLVRGNLRGLDLSRLALRGMYLQGVEMQDTRLSEAVVQDSVFTEAFDDILAVAISHTGNAWAAASRRGEIRVWEAGGLTLRHSWRAHTDMIWAIAFSPDSRTLASGSWDGTFKLWDVVSGALRWSGRHADHMHHLAFAPDGRTLATSGPDATVRLWDIQNGTYLQTLPHPAPVLSITWSLDGHLLISGDEQGGIRLWEVQQTGPAVCIWSLHGHARLVDGLAIAPDGRTLASGSWDGTVKLWNMADGRLQRTLTGHTDKVRRVVWSPDGHMLASCGFEQTIWLWSVEQESYRAALQGHSAEMTSLAFTPDSRTLLSSSEDGTVRVWDVATRQCLRVMQGYVASLYDIAWSPDGSQLVSGGTDRLVMIHTVDGGKPLRVLDGESNVMFGVGWSPDGRMVASSEWVNVIRLWSLASGTYHKVLQHPDDSDNYFHGVAWSPDGQRLASGTSRHGVLIWNMTTHRPQWGEATFPTWIRPVAWSPDGTQVAGGGDDGAVYVWDTANGTLLARLVGHHAMVTSVAWSANGTRLASGARGSESGELFVWDVQRWEPIRPFAGPPQMVTAIAWGASEDVLMSGGSDGHLRWWDVQRGKCMWVRQAHQATVQALKVSPDGRRLASCGDDGAILLWDIHTGEYLQTVRRDRPYERMDITGLTGISDAQRASLLALGAVEQHSEPALPSMTIPEPTATDQLMRGQHPTHTLPLLPTSFVGRGEELNTINTLLADQSCRLLTLIGPGGIGKTRLALEIAAAQTVAYADGALFVALASVGASDQIISAIGDTLGLSFAGQSDATAYLLRYLCERHMLLILDNFEHLLAGAELVVDILAHAPRVTVIVTSRERLNVQAEWLFDVGGLACPPENAHEFVPSQRQEDVADYSAVQLFIQRATQVQSELVFDEATLLTITRICQHVAGMPLAIELAATSARMLSLATIERRIQANLDALVTTLRDVPSRHRSMRAVFTHSWNLLNEPERMLFSRLAVFRGSWALTAAINVTGATPRVLTALIDKSLVVSQEPTPNVPESRFTLLVPIREYALEQLVARDEVAALQRAHATYYLALAETVAAQWDSPTAEEGIAQLEREYDNLRAVLRWACDGGDRMLGLRLGGALRKYWQRRWYYSEGRTWLEELLAADDLADSVTTAARINGLDVAASLASDHHDYVRAAQLFAQSTALRRSLGVNDGETHGFGNAARQARAAGQYSQATALLEELVAYHRARGDRGRWTTRGLGMTLYELGMACREQGDFARAIPLFAECVALHREIKDDEGMAIGLLGLGDVARDQGDVAQLHRCCEESLAILRRLGVTWATGFALNNLALGACLEGDLMRATELVNQSLSLFQGVQSDIMRAEVLITWGRILLARGDDAAAYAALTEAVQLTMVLGPRLMVAYALEGLAAVVIVKGESHLAIQCLAAASVLREQMGTPVRPIDQAAVDTVLASARSILGVDTFTVVWRTAHTMPLEQLLSTVSTAIAYTIPS